MSGDIIDVNTQTSTGDEMSLEAMNVLLKELKEKIPNPQILKPDDWSMDQKRAYIEFNTLNVVMGNKIQAEFKTKYGFK